MAKVQVKANVKANGGKTPAPSTVAPNGPAAKMAAIALKAKGDNCYRPHSAYWSVVEALRKLGIGKHHSADALVKMFPLVMGKDKYSEFKAKDKRTENGKEPVEKIIQNAEVTARIDYGRPLRCLGWEVQRERRADGLFFCLCKLAPKDVKAAQALKIVRQPRTVVPPAPPVKSKAPPVKAPPVKAKGMATQAYEAARRVALDSVGKGKGKTVKGKAQQKGGKTVKA